MYFVVVAARSSAALPPMFRALSLFTDSDDGELARVDRDAREVLRLDGILRTRDEQLHDQFRHARELHAMVEHRDHVIAERERTESALREELAAVVAERERLVGQVGAQQRIITYRESVRWWLKLPLLRIRRLWIRIRAA
jgi:hypothetical protein